MERLDYPTQKPEALLERIIKAIIQRRRPRRRFLLRLRHHRRGGGKAGPQVDRHRPRQVRHPHHPQAADRRAAGAEGRGQDFRAFEILNLGRYERQAYLHRRTLTGEAEGAEAAGGKGSRLPRPDPARLQGAAAEDRRLRIFHGKKAGRLVVVGPVNLPVTRLFVEEIILECRKKHITRVDIWASSSRWACSPTCWTKRAAKGIDIAPKYIPAEVFDKRAVEKNQVVFHDVSFIEVKPRYVKKNKLAVAIELTDFSVFYSQGAAEAAIAAMKEGKSKIVVREGPDRQGEQGQGRHRHPRAC